MNGYLKRSVLLATALLAYSVLTPSARGASFDCAKAGTKVERMICDDPELSKLDEVLAQAYRAALQDIVKAEQVKQAQKLWMKKRNACSDAKCLRTTYQTRTHELIAVQKQADTDQYICVEQDLDESTDFLFHIEPDPKTCQLYLENLNYFAHQNLPLSCNRPIAPKFKDRIKEVEWEDLKPSDYLELFRQVVLFTSLGTDKSPESLQKNEQMVAEGAYVFRRAKLALRGTPRGQTALHGERDKSRKDYTGQFYIIQYGSNNADTNRPVMPCKPTRGIWPGENQGSMLDLYLVSVDMNEVISSLGTLSRGQQGEHMLLIDGKPYVEGILPDANVRLYRLSLGTHEVQDVFLEMLCEYRFESSCRLPGRETFDPNQPMCKPNL